MPCVATIACCNGILKVSAMESEMNKVSQARLIATDFAASIVMAASIGLATSVTLAGAVLLLAEQSAGETAQTAPVHDGGSS